MDSFKRFSDVRIGEQFHTCNYDYVKIENVCDNEGDWWNAFNMELHCLAYFWNGAWVIVEGE